MRLFFLFLLLVTCPAMGFENAYLKLSLPNNWGSDLLDGVWIFQGKAEPDRRESIVLSIAASATDWDSIDNYEKYLKKTRTIEEEDGTKLKSEVRYTRRRNINGFVWIDSLQKNSEVPGFWTRYLATIQKLGKHKLAILVTYIVSNENYKKMAPQFERMVASLRPKDQLSLNTPGKTDDPDFLGSEIVGPGHSTKNILKERLRKRVKPAPPPSYGPKLVTILLILLGGYFFWLWRNKTQKASKKPKEPRISKNAS